MTRALARSLFRCRPRLIAAVALVFATASACTAQDDDAAPPATQAVTTTTSASTTIPPTTIPSTTTSVNPGAPSDTCRSGWTAPAPDDPWLVEAVQLIQEQTSAPGTLEVLEARLFSGPDVPQILEPRVEDFRIAYVVAQVPGTEFVGRFLVTRRSDERRGLEAVAPIGTHGFEGWYAFEGGGGPTTFDDLPGEWYGLRYDFVTGADGPGYPGLDESAVGCLEGT